MVVVSQRPASDRYSHCSTPFQRAQNTKSLGLYDT
jgi:hypothetical protein